MSTYDLWIMVAYGVLVASLGAVFAYARGFKDGHSEGYVRGRAISAAIADRAKL
jgi:hypothetical protein